MHSAVIQILALTDEIIKVRVTLGTWPLVYSVHCRCLNHAHSGCSSLEDALKLPVCNSPGLCTARMRTTGRHLYSLLHVRGRNGLSFSPAHQPSWKLLKVFWHNTSERVLCPCVLTCLFVQVLNKRWQKILNVCQIWERG